MLSSLIACSQEAGKPSQSEVDPAVAPSGATAPAPLVTDMSEDVNPRLLRRFQALSPSFESDANPLTRSKIDLGRKLYYETRLSKSGQLSCNSCHDLDAYGVDNSPTSRGFDGKLGGRNSPTVYNAAGSFVQFWDGRAPSVEEQAKGPILNPIEMGMPNAGAVVAALKGIRGYADEFKRAFPEDDDPVTFDNVGRAIGAFERKLVTPGRWDKFLRGDKSALTSAEKEGLKTFLNVGCMVCHTGPYLGASMYERVGVVEPWPNQKDTGRGEVTKAAGDRMMFKVPTLRNIEKTAPYFHDGSSATLEDAVHMMGKHQLGLELSQKEIASIVTWLKSLTGDLPKDYIAKPDVSEAKASSPAPRVAVEASGVSSAPAPSATCGGAGLPDCPLQSWMKANAMSALTASDFARMEVAFDRIAELGPPEYTDWRADAKAGRDAARAGDLEGCRNACKSCHDAYRAPYRQTRRTRPLR